MALRFLILITFILTIVATAAVTLLVQKQEPSGANTASSPHLNQEAVEAIISNYLQEKPELIVEAFTLAKQKQQLEEQRKAEENIAARRKDLENDATTPFAGAEDGDVVIVKFSDYNCGYCKRVMPSLDTLLKEDDGVKLVVKDFPILGRQSTENSKAALAAFNLDAEKYFAFHQKMLQQTPRTNEQIYALASSLGYDAETFKAEMQKPKYAKKIDENLALGSAVGVRGTPAFIINGEFVPGAIGLEQFRQKVRAARGS